MRKSLIAFLTCCSIGTSAQITLEHTYDQTGRFHGLSQLMLIELEFSGLKYVSIDQLAKEIRFYHLDHTLYKTISFAMAPYNPAWDDGFTPDIMYISEHLFDMDDDVEYMFVWNTGTNGSTTILDEDGSIHLNVPQEMPLIRPNVPTQQYPIYNTPFGTKLILSTVDSTARVYSLPGQLTVTLLPEEADASHTMDVKIYPNPGVDEITVELGKHSNLHTDLVIYDSLGSRSKEVGINGGSILTIPIGDLSNGQYYMVLSGGVGKVPCGTFIKK